MSLVLPQLALPLLSFPCTLAILSASVIISGAATIFTASLYKAVTSEICSAAIFCSSSVPFRKTSCFAFFHCIKDSFSMLLGASAGKPRISNISFIAGHPFPNTNQANDSFLLRIKDFIAIIWFSSRSDSPSISATTSLPEDTAKRNLVRGVRINEPSALTI